MRTTLDYLALAEPLRRNDLTALAGEDAVEQAEAAGAVVVDDDAMVLFGPSALRSPRGGGAGTGHRPGVAYVAGRATHGRPGRSCRRPAAARGAGHRQRPPRRHRWFRGPASAAVGELGLAERLARAALDRSEGLAARLALGYALAWQGRGREADVVLSAVDPEQLSPPELMAWALPRAANQFWMLSEPAQATAFLQTTRGRVASPSAQATLDALTATFAMNSGTPLRTLRIAARSWPRRTPTRWPSGGRPRRRR